MAIDPAANRMMEAIVCANRMTEPTAATNHMMEAIVAANCGGPSNAAADRMRAIEPLMYRSV